MLTLAQLKAVCQRLNKGGVKYVVIGGFAIILHGFERATRDIDLLVDPSRKNIHQLKEALSSLLPEACMEMTDDDVAKNTVVRMAGQDLVVDLIGKVGDIDYSKAKIIEEEVGGVVIPVADLDTMLELKKGVRERDTRDYLFLKGKKEYLKGRKTL